MLICAKQIAHQGARMTGTTNNGSAAPQGSEEEEIPAMQKLLDNPFLLLFIGIMMPTVFYIIWGVMEIVTIPLAR
jgi:hypothetical protein